VPRWVLFSTKNTSNASKILAQFVCQSPKVKDLKKKVLSGYP
jgi:hypothetical protein